MERHPLRIGYLVAGLVFVAVAIVGLTDIRLFRVAELAWAGPGLLVLLGIVLVVGTATRRGDRDTDDRDTGDRDTGDTPDTTAADDGIEEQAPAS